MLIGTKIKEGKILVLKHAEDLLEEAVDRIVVITNIINEGEPAELGSVLYNETDVEYYELELYTRNTFKLLMLNDIISHEYRGSSNYKYWLLHHLIQYERDLPDDLLHYVCFESGERYDLSGSLSLVVNLNTAKWLQQQGVTPAECDGYPNAYIVWQRAKNTNIIDYFNSVKPVRYNPFWNYLEGLRRSGITNMYGAAPYLSKEFGLTTNDSVAILCDWMKKYDRNDYDTLKVAEEFMA